MYSNGTWLDTSILLTDAGERFSNTFSLGMLSTKTRGDCCFSQSESSSWLGLYVVPVSPLEQCKYPWLRWHGGYRRKSQHRLSSSQYVLSPLSRRLPLGLFFRVSIGKLSFLVAEYRRVATSAKIMIRKYLSHLIIVLMIILNVLYLQFLDMRNLDHEKVHGWVVHKVFKRFSSEFRVPFPAYLFAL